VVVLKFLLKIGNDRVKTNFNGGSQGGTGDRRAERGIGMWHRRWYATAGYRHDARSRAIHAAPKGAGVPCGPVVLQTFRP
jgi:hypothetical protein